MVRKNTYQKNDYVQFEALASTPVNNNTMYIDDSDKDLKFINNDSVNEHITKGNQRIKIYIQSSTPATPIEGDIWFEIWLKVRKW